MRDEKFAFGFERGANVLATGNIFLSAIHHANIS
jgi:hypothetical protein